MKKEKRTPQYYAYRRRLIVLAAAFVLVILAGIFLFPQVFREHNRENGNGERGSGGYKRLEVVRAATPVRIAAEDDKGRHRLNEENPVEDEFLQKLSEFSFRSMATLEEAYPAENILYSPFSLYYALAMTAEGAAGETKQELLSLLLGAGDMAEQCGNLYRRLYRDNEVGKFQIANSLWLADNWNGQKINWKKSYLQTASKDFYSSVFAADFGDNDTGKAMSGWISDHTGGLLSPEFEANPAQVAAIVNTIYLKDEWKDRFLEERTAKDLFYLSDVDGDTVECEFMNGVDWGGFYQGDGYTRSSLRLKQTGRMVFVLPDEDGSVEELLADSERLTDAFTGGEGFSGKITWKIPKLVCGMDGSLKDLVQTLGAKSCFQDGQADFSEMVEKPVAPYISEVRQGTKLILNEMGVEAASYTVAELETSGAMIEEEELEAYMILDRPFLYGIMTEDGTPLFLGVCRNPVE